MRTLTIIFLFISSSLFAQSKGFMMKGDTLLYVRDVGDTVQISRNVPPMIGQAGKVLSTNGAAYQWITNSASTSWGGITGTLSNQSDLQIALDGKQGTLVSATNIKTVNGNSLLGSGNVPIGGGPTFLNLANAFSSTSTTPAAVTGWSFAVSSGVTYRIEVIGDYQTAATTTGGIIGISLTGATGSVRGFARGSITASAAATDLAIPIRVTSGAGSTLTTTAVSAINTPHFIHLLVTFTCTGNGTFNIVWGSEVNASAAQINQNSTLLYQALN